jgi:hypothetical protein
MWITVRSETLTVTRAGKAWIGYPYMVRMAE